jgi:16S rRNA (guanine966-N2)-methyltransferase
MRIIAGTARGTPLKVPAEGARPTSDRVREAIFSILGERVVDARVLDLFAGSGAMGIEALSRGAALAAFVDAQRKTCEVISANLAKARLGVNASVHCSDAFAFLARAGAGPGCDLVFADPPYRKRPEDRDFAGEILASTDLSAIIAADGILVLETGRAVAKDVGPVWKELDRRSYGDTIVTFLVSSSV